jgi:hypothetical protein
MKATDIQKEILKSKVNANFSHYESGNLYYTVKLESGKYLFPIAVTERIANFTYCGSLFVDNLGYCQLSKDLGNATFGAVEKASLLNRWIKKSIENNNFIKIG